MNAFQEGPREIPVRGEYDVIVCGAGLGGVAAATAAARRGAKTLLVERNTFLGGVASAGMCCSIFNCYYTGGQPRKLGTTGIAVEVADALAASAGYGRKWHRHKGHIIYDIEQGKRVLQELVEKAGAEILLQAWTAGAVIEDGAGRGVIVESKSGREAIRARVVVDATGDADIAAFAGVPLRIHTKANHSFCFRLGNIDVDAFVDHFRKHPDDYPKNQDVEWSIGEAIAQYDECGTFLFPHHGGSEFPPLQKAKEAGMLPPTVGIQDSTDTTQMHALRRTGVVHIVTGYTHFDGLDADHITRSVADGRRMAFVVADAFRRYVPGFTCCFVAGTAANLGVRHSRSIDGDFTLARDMLQGGTRHPDAVGTAVAWENRGAQCLFSDSFDLPYRCLLPRHVDGLLMGAGRSISAENHGCLRVMAHTMVVGQAAGTAAAAAVRDGVEPRDVNAASVREEPGNLT